MRRLCDKSTTRAAVADEVIDRRSFTATCIAYLEAALDPEVRRIVLQDGPSVLDRRLRDIDQKGSIEPLRQAIVELQQSGDFIDGDAGALAVLINGAMIDAALWIADGEDDQARDKVASQALSAFPMALSRKK